MWVLPHFWRWQVCVEFWGKIFPPKWRFHVVFGVPFSCWDVFISVLIFLVRRCNFIFGLGALDFLIYTFFSDLDIYWMVKIIGFDDMILRWDSEECFLRFYCLLWTGLSSQAIQAILVINISNRSLIWWRLRCLVVTWLLNQRTFITVVI